MNCDAAPPPTGLPGSVAERRPLSEWRRSARSSHLRVRNVYGYILRLGAVWATSAARGRIDSMESHPAELLRDALALPLEARTALIDSLIESLDATVDEGATEAWKREIELRLKQIDDGTVELISWSAARKRLRDQLEP